MSITKEAIGEVIANFVASSDAELLAKSAKEIAAEWYWSWDKDHSSQYNLYTFSTMLEIHKRRWRRWEEYHNGHACVVERIRDKYVMPRIREFFLALSIHEQETD